jgi:hypothetical protein
LPVPAGTRSLPNPLVQQSHPYREVHLCHQTNLIRPPSVEPTTEPTPSPPVEVAPEQEPVVSAEPVEAPAEPVAEPEQEPVVVSAEPVEAAAVAEPPAEGEQPA